MGTLDFGSIKTAGEGSRSLTVAEDDMGRAVGAALSISDTRGLRLARGILASAPDGKTAVGDARRLVDWAATGDSEQRQLIARTLRLDGADLILVDQMATLPRAQARPFMADYLATTNDLRPIAQWLATVGGVLREHGVKDQGTSGFVIDFVEEVGEAVEDAVDAIGEAVETVVDAIVDAGRAIADVIAEVVSWSVAQVADLVRALVAAGKTVAELLAAAAASGLELLRKFVRAVLDAGRTLAEVPAHAVTQTIGALGDIVNALRDAAIGLVDVVRWAATQAADVIRMVVEATLAIGRAVVDVIAAAVQAAASVALATVRAC
ncbi:MAG: hypothetical protein H0U79_07440 [Solirubrobacterales bacterium]|nr:hypothetical protein [Solirubrobacterales bacterium]